ncbi:hypothetical protein L195_g050698, partial [Trifolium pratense]
MEFALNSLYMDRPVFLEDGSPQLDEEGEQVTEWSLRFPLSWSSEHFLLRTDEYLTAGEDLSPAEMAGFEKLKVYVDGFKPCKVITSLGDVALDKHGKPRIEPRFVNTKLLLSCKTVASEDTLLGRMADLASELMRIAAEHKGEKPKKKLRWDPGRSCKEAAGGTDDSYRRPVGGGRWLCPPRVLEQSEVSLAARQNQLNEDVAAVIRLAEMALVLNEGGATHEVEKLAARNAKLEGHIVKLEGELIDLRGKQENYGNLLEEARVTREELEKTK